jgi:FlaA1/EpsC-like NDP-sugar epimerase
MDQSPVKALLLNLPRSTKRLVVLALDSCLCVFALWLALYLRLGEFVYLDWQYALALTMSLVLALPIFLMNGLYRAIFRYSGWPALMTVAKSVAIYGILYATIFTAFGIAGTPRTIGLIQPILLFILIGASRSVAYYWLGGDYKRRIGANAKVRMLVYGAGSAGRQIAAALVGNREVKIVGFMDDDPNLIGRVLNGLTIYRPSDIIEQSRRLDVTDVLLALPSASHRRRQEIVDELLAAKLSVRTLPSLTDIAQGKVSINDIKELDIDDLLGRAPVEPDDALLRRNITGKKVMVTGAGGSIGSELCRQILRLNPADLILVDHSEFALYTINEELNALRVRYAIELKSLVPVLGSVRDRNFVKRMVAHYKPDTIYHAAAYKHVPLVEENVIEGVLNNTLGTKLMAEAAIDNAVQCFVLISTDKAVRPTNAMGASKRMAELVLQALADEQSGTCFSMVRFGNVLDSSGSVVPKFRQQIKEGGPVTVTHPDVTRYFMTIPEAAQLVIQAGSMANGGDVFFLEMGAPVKVLDLARRMIELSGMSIKDTEQPAGDIEITFTGLREGEKLHEELLLGAEPEETGHPRITKAHEKYIPLSELDVYLEQLNEADENQALEILSKLVSGFHRTT